MKRIVTAALTLCVAFGLTAVAQKATVSQSLTAEAALGAAIHQEEVEGNVEGAIASYKKIISQIRQQPSARRQGSIPARARLRETR